MQPNHSNEFEKVVAMERKLSIGRAFVSDEFWPLFALWAIII